MSCVQKMVLALLPVVLLASAALGKALQAIIHGVMYELTGRKAGEYAKRQTSAVNIQETSPGKIPASGDSVTRRGVSEW